VLRALETSSSGYAINRLDRSGDDLHHFFLTVKENFLLLFVLKSPVARRICLTFQPVRFTNDSAVNFQSIVNFFSSRCGNQPSARLKRRLKAFIIVWSGANLLVCDPFRASRFDTR